MAIFPVLELEPIVQVGDKTRLKADKSFITPDNAAITKIEIDPGNGTFIDVTSTQYLEWAYPTAGAMVPKLKITAGAVVTLNAASTVVTEADDKLFSQDSDLVLHEPDIMKWVAAGRATYKDMHRRAQTVIIQWLDKEGYVDVFNKRFEKEAIINVEEVRPWSTYLTLRLIFEGLSNAIDDIFSEKAKRYKGMEVDFRSKALLRIDINDDGVIDIAEGIDPAYGFIARR